jgi:pimeloyl-ACP methyl ester carboxylesterase
MVADDHVAVLDQLGIDHIRVVGWSQGGLAALAFAARHPERVIDATIVGTPAPNDQVAWIPDEFVGFLAMLRNDPGSAVAALAPEFVEIAADPNAAVHGLLGGSVDETALGSDGLRERLEQMLAVAFVQQGLGLVYDIVATNVAPAGFDPATIGVPVSLVYGTNDELIPTTHGEYYRDQLGTPSFRLLWEATSRSPRNGRRILG